MAFLQRQKRFLRVVSSSGIEKLWRHNGALDGATERFRVPMCGHCLFFAVDKDTGGVAREITPKKVRLPADDCQQRAAVPPRTVITLAGLVRLPTGIF